MTQGETEAQLSHAADDPRGGARAPAVARGSGDARGGRAAGAQDQGEERTRTDADPMEPAVPLDKLLIAGADPDAAQREPGAEEGSAGLDSAGADRRCRDRDASADCATS